MPISIQLSRGLLTAAGEREVFSRISDALLQVHGLGGNAFLAPTVIGHVDIYPEEHSYAGGKPQSLAVIEVKVPSATFPDQSVKAASSRRPRTSLMSSRRANTRETVPSST